MGNRITPQPMRPLPAADRRPSGDASVRTGGATAPQQPAWPDPGGLMRTATRSPTGESTAATRRTRVGLPSDGPGGGSALPPSLQIGRRPVGQAASASALPASLHIGHRPPTPPPDLPPSLQIGRRPVPQPQPLPPPPPSRPIGRRPSPPPLPSIGPLASPPALPSVGRGGGLTRSNGMRAMQRPVGLATRIDARASTPGVAPADIGSAKPAGRGKPALHERVPNLPMPPHAVFQQTSSMLKAYVGEETGQVWGTKVKHMNDAERQAAKLHFNTADQRFYQGDSKIPFDTREASSVFGGGEGRAIFVVDPMNGSIYASKYQEEGKFHHSSFLGNDAHTGLPRQVAMAGEIRIVEGKLEQISPRSGHFRPPKQHMLNFANHLVSQGVPPDFDLLNPRDNSVIPKTPDEALQSSN